MDVQGLRLPTSARDSAEDHAGLPGAEEVRRKAALRQAIGTLEGLDQVRRRVKKLEKHLQLSLLHVKMIERELGLDASAAR